MDNNGELKAEIEALWRVIGLLRKAHVRHPFKMGFHQPMGDDLGQTLADSKAQCLECSLGIDALCHGT